MTGQLSSLASAGAGLLPQAAGDLLVRAWAGLLVHLWQSTIVLGLLLLGACVLRRAPGNRLEGLWALGLAKLAFPLALGGLLWQRLALDGPLREWLPFAEPGGARPDGAAGWTLGVLDAIVRPGGVLPVDGLAWGAAARWAAVALTLVWAAVAAARVAAILRDLRHERPHGPRDAATGDAPAAPLPRRLERALDGICPPEAVVVSGDLGLPRVVGLIRPRVVLPRHLLRLELSDLRGILRHEDAHRRRRDPLRRLGLRLCAAALWFYPPVHWLAARLSSAAEVACDDRVLAAGTEARTYSRALARAMHLALVPSRTAGAGLISDSTLRERFARLDQPGRIQPMKMHTTVLAIAAVLVAAASFWPAPPIQATAEVAQEVTAPVLVRMGQLVYPEAERKAGIEGMVRLRATVEVDGSVSGITADLEVEGHPALTTAAMDVLRTAVFEPAMKHGKPVRTEIMVPFRFALDSKKDGEKQ